MCSHYGIGGAKYLYIYSAVNFMHVIQHITNNALIIVIGHAQLNNFRTF